MTKEQKNNYINNLGLSDYAKEFINDYYALDIKCFDDFVSEFADQNTSIYYNDIEKYISNNVDTVNDYVNEYMRDSDFDLYKAGQGAEYMDIYNEISQQSDDIKKALLIEHFWHIDNIDFDKIANIIDNDINLDNDDLTILIDEVNELYKDGKQ